MTTTMKIKNGADLTQKITCTYQVTLKYMQTQHYDVICSEDLSESLIKEIIRSHAEELDPDIFSSGYCTETKPHKILIQKTHAPYAELSIQRDEDDQNKWRLLCDDESLSNFG